MCVCILFSWCWDLTDGWFLTDPAQTGTEDVSQQTNFIVFNYWPGVPHWLSNCLLSLFNSLAGFYLCLLSFSALFSPSSLGIDFVFSLTVDHIWLLDVLYIYFYTFMFFLCAYGRSSIPNMFWHMTVKFSFYRGFDIECSWSFQSLQQPYFFFLHGVHLGDVGPS